MKTILTKIIVTLCVAASLSGCALMISDVQGLYDIKEAHIRVFDKSISRCYQLTHGALKTWQAVAYHQSVDDYIVAMELEKAFKSCINTTELGIFFTEISPGKTEVKVTSLNYNLSRSIAVKLFEYIEKDGNIPKEDAPLFSNNARPKE